MDIIVKQVLDFVQAQKGRENSIIAGGAIRDEVFGLIPNDYDLCIPSKSGKDMQGLAGSIAEAFQVKVFLKSQHEYHESNNGQRLTTVYSFILESKKFDLIGHREENDEDFAKEVINKFDFGVNMVYHNGLQLCDDDDRFQCDYNYGEMSLHNLESINKLPLMVDRYNRFVSRVNRPIIFRAPCLTLREEKKKADKLANYMKHYGGWASNPAAEMAAFEPSVEPWDIPTTLTPPTQPMGTHVFNGGTTGTLFTNNIGIAAAAQAVGIEVGPVNSIPTAWEDELPH